MSLPAAFLTFLILELLSMLTLMLIASMDVWL